MPRNTLSVKDNRRGNRTGTRSTASQSLFDVDRVPGHRLGSAAGHRCFLSHINWHAQFDLGLKQPHDRLTFAEAIGAAFAIADLVIRPQAKRVIDGRQHVAG